MRASGAGIGFFQGDVKKLVTEDIPLLKPTLMAGTAPAPRVPGSGEGGGAVGRSGGGQAPSLAPASLRTSARPPAVPPHPTQR